MVYLFTLGFVVIAAVQVWYCVKRHLYKEVAVSVMLMGIAILYSYSIILDWNLPILTDFITKVLAPVSKYVFRGQYEW